MRAVILAAGKGTRISRHIDGKPKCTVSLGVTTLIEHTIEQLKSRNITQIALVLGYEGHVIRDLLSGSGVKFYENPFFSVTNSIASLWFARDFMAAEDDYLFMNGDVFCEDTMIDRIIEEAKSPVLFADSSRIIEADYKLYFPQGTVIKYGKELTPEETTGEYIGMAKVRIPDMNQFRTQLDSLIAKGESGLWWENILYTLSDKNPIAVQDLNGLFWGEVDFIEDYERIQSYYNDEVSSASFCNKNC